jgi:hypothetical protein
MPDEGLFLILSKREAVRTYYLGTYCIEPGEGQSSSRDHRRIRIELLEREVTYLIAARNCNAAYGGIRGSREVLCCAVTAIIEQISNPESLKALMTSYPHLEIYRCYRSLQIATLHFPRNIGYIYPACMRAAYDSYVNTGITQG